MANQPDPHARTILPISDVPQVGLTTYDARDPATTFPPIEPLRPPAGAPNILIILIDDAGFGASSAFGGPCQAPTAEQLAAGGLKYTRFHTTALCSPTRQALLTGRNHHSVNMAGVTELATSAPGYTSLLPKEKAPIAMTLKLNGYSTAQFGKCHEVPVWQTSPMGPFDQTQPLIFSCDETCDVGHEGGSPTSPDYGTQGNTFSGEVNWVQIDLGPDDHDHLISPEERYQVVMARQ